MSTRLARIAIGMVCVGALPALSLADNVIKPVTANTHAKLHLPATTTAQHGIIFVGGTPQSTAGHASLNPQPIPPGHSITQSVGPRLSGGDAALNTQPIPPGRQHQ